ncbi:MAG: PH domain-containing protein [Treponema sp.]|nr:PH domain-containing protein [Treponema sp.]
MVKPSVGRRKYAELAADRIPSTLPSMWRLKMGFLSGLLGNASGVSVEEVTKEYGFVLAQNETIEVAYKLIRDYFIFTKKRLILVDKQGITGKKVEVQSIPYRNIIRFAVETAGHLDLDAELKIWVSGSQNPIEKKFNKSVNIYEVQAILADAIAGSA